VCGRCGWSVRSLNGEPSEDYSRDLEGARRRWEERSKAKISEACVIAPGERLTVKAESRFMSAAMVLVEGGTFRMGGDGDDDEQPIHEVTVSDFYIGKYPVTQREYQVVMNGENPSEDKGDDLPVDNVSWYDAVKFCNVLSQKDGLDEVYTINGDQLQCDWGKIGYRLPTEAEWEYAARGGWKSRGYECAGSDDIEEVAWYNDNSGDHTHPVGQKKANELGLHDMSGNVAEWCWDWFDDGYYRSSPKTDPTGPASGSRCVVRGGGWLTMMCHVRSAKRFHLTPDNRGPGLGFRLVCPAVQ
jgi:formylglycine-generating enzyme